MSAPEKAPAEMTPAELFDEITADGSNFSDKASRARAAGLEALRRLQGHAERIRELETDLSAARVALRGTLKGTGEQVYELYGRLKRLNSRLLAALRPHGLGIHEIADGGPGSAMFDHPAADEWIIRKVEALVTHHNWHHSEAGENV
jgi:hypothetical protein